MLVNPVQPSLLRILFAIVLYLVLVFAIIWWKPSAMFDSEHRPRKPGFMHTENDQSIFAPVIVFPLLAVLSYFIASWFDLARPAVPRAIRIAV